MYVPEILYIDNHIIAVNKNSSEIVQGDKTGDLPLSEILKLYIKEKYKKPGNVFLGVTHRLDRPVSGIVLFARTDKALSRLNEMFREKKIQKKYFAIVKNKPPENEGQLVHFLAKNEKQNKSYVVQDSVAGAKKAILEYKIIAASDNYFKLEIILHTGRHHQIRCQLAAIGCPIKGDLKYGFQRSNKNKGISLHAGEISFTHPVSKEFISIKAPFPTDDIWGSFR